MTVDQYDEPHIIIIAKLYNEEQPIDALRPVVHL